MKIALGSDHAGFAYKEQIARMLKEAGHEVADCGTFSADPVDYPLYIAPAAQAVARGECERAIVLGGSGNGEAIVANKIPGVRCSLCWNLDTARWGRMHNNANVLSIGERTVTLELALQIVQVWLDTPFEGGRHVPRVEAIASLERSIAAGLTGPYPIHEKTLLIRPEHLNQRGTLFGGYMMQWADDLAFNAATLTFPDANFVTRRVEAFDFSSPVQSGDIVKLYAHVKRVGNTSCAVEVTCRNARTDTIVFSTTAIMVHLDPDGQKGPIPR